MKNQTVICGDSLTTMNKTVGYCRIIITKGERAPRDRDRQTNRQTDRDRETEKQREREREIERERERESERQLLPYTCKTTVGNQQRLEVQKCTFQIPSMKR